VGNTFHIYCYKEDDEDGILWIGFGPLGISLRSRDLGLGPAFVGRVEPAEHGSILRGRFRVSIDCFVILLACFYILSECVVRWSELHNWISILLGLLLTALAYRASGLMSRVTTGASRTINLLERTFFHAVVTEENRNDNGE